MTDVVYAIESLREPGKYLVRSPFIYVLASGGGATTLFFSDRAEADRAAREHGGGRVVEFARVRR